MADIVERLNSYARWYYVECFTTEAPPGRNCL